jgi:hypothetical protein
MPIPRTVTPTYRKIKSGEWHVSGVQKHTGTKNINIKIYNILKQASSIQPLSYQHFRIKSTKLTENMKP